MEVAVNVLATFLFFFLPFPKPRPNVKSPNPPNHKKSKHNMETRSQAKKKKQNLPTPPQGFRNWLDLPQDLLFLIIHHLSLSIPDLLSFSGTCRSWYAAASIACASIPIADRPPLLLNPKLSFKFGRLRWIEPAKCYFKSLTTERAHKSVLPAETLTKRCIGSSFGCLIFDLNSCALIVNVFNGDEILTPDFPKPLNTLCRFETAILTEPPEKENCRLLVVSRESTLCWKIRSEVWIRELYLRFDNEIKTLNVFNGLVYCLDWRYRVKVLEFNDLVTWKTLDMEFLEGKFPLTSFAKYLVECDGDILLVDFVSMGLRRNKFTIDVYRLDFERLTWLKKENLGNWCLFIDVVGHCVIACSNPEKWGGRSNCVYFVGPGNDNWLVFPYDGSEVNVKVRKQALNLACTRLPKWPSPVWVCPSKLLEQGKYEITDDVARRQGNGNIIIE